MFFEMKYSCRLCNFKWEGYDGIQDVLIHERTHESISEKTNK